MKFQVALRAYTVRDELASDYLGTLTRIAETGCDVVEALDAAHIKPYAGPETNHISNGLLLRSDIHNLFDLGLIAIDEDSLDVLVADSLIDTEYDYLAHAHLASPRSPRAKPSKTALKAHRHQAELSKKAATTEQTV